MSGKRKGGAQSEERDAMGRQAEGAMFPVAPPRIDLPWDYAETLKEIKLRVLEGRLRVVLKANSAMVLLYWDIGRMILERQERGAGAPRSLTGLRRTSRMHSRT